MRYFKTFCFGFLVATALVTRCESSLFADRIEDCPDLPPRPAPTSVMDLRPDDIKVVAAMGDSILAGATSLGLLDGQFFNKNLLLEARGLTYAAGADPGRITIPNFIKKYSPDVKGGSKSKHVLEYCLDGLCNLNQFKPELDQLNAAQSAAKSNNLPLEIEYIAKTMKTIPGLDFENDWKLLTLQIGGLDQCTACYPGMQKTSDPDFYAKNVEVMLEYVKNNIPRSIVNLIGVFNVTTVYPLTLHHPYCNASIFGGFQVNMIECLCALNPDNVILLNDIATGYSNKLRDLHLKYKAQQTDDFGVIYTPANINFTQYPIELFSDLDCYHPSIKGHENLAKTFWRPLFLPLEERPAMLGPENGERVYCPDENDRFII
ncbi:unnamed protein product [Rhizopus stolonifer]